MLTINHYVKAKTLEEAYELNQARNARIMGGMMWMRLGNAKVQTIIDISGLGLDQIEETDHVFRIGAMCTCLLYTSICIYTAGFRLFFQDRADTGGTGCDLQEDSGSGEKKDTECAGYR